MKKYPLNAKSACLITDRLTRQYLSGVDLAEGVFIFSDKSVMFTDARYYSGVKDAFISKGVEIELYTSPSEIKDYLLSTGVKTLYLDYSRTTVKEYQSYGEWGGGTFRCFGYTIRNAFYQNRRRINRYKDGV